MLNMNNKFVIFAENYKGKLAFIKSFDFSNNDIEYTTTESLQEALIWEDKDWEEANKLNQICCPCAFDLVLYNTALDAITPKLYEVYLGGEPEAGSIVEPHELVWVVALNEKQAKQKAKLKWLGHGKVHIDGIKQLNTIDGYTINLIKVSEAEPYNEVEINTNWKSLND